LVPILRSVSRAIFLRCFAVLASFALVTLPAAQAAPDRLGEACASIEELIARPLEVVSEKLGSKPIARQTAAGAEKLVEDQLVDELFDWIAANTRYDVSEARQRKPTISFCDFGEKLDYEHKDLIVESIFRGIYDKEKRHIYLVAPWSPDSLKNVGTLLHELIHDVQCLNREWSCWGRAEWEAYKLQEKWLKARGVDPEFPWIRIFLETRCARDVHP
jgi:hypothetical protein